MAGGTERLLRRRIRTIQSTQKITRAMQLIAASRIVRAQAAVAAAQPYSEAITAVIHDLSSGGGPVASPLLQPRDETRKVAHIVVAADRGLCGAYNSSVIRAAEASLREDASAARDYSMLVVGRRAEGSFRYRGYHIDAAFTGFSDKPTYEDARRIGEVASAAFVAGETDLVEIVYTRFVSVGRQEVVRETLMPLSRDDIAEELGVSNRVVQEEQKEAIKMLNRILARDELVELGADVDTAELMSVFTAYREADAQDEAEAADQPTCSRG